MRKIALIAPPGGGKGTQAAKIKDELQIPHISTGDIFRAIIKGTYSGSFPREKIMSYVDKGALVPDSIVIEVVKDRLSQEDCKKGYLLDGFPRNLEQAKLFDEMLSDNLNRVIELTVDEENLMKRLTGRRSCSKCGKIYNIYYHQPKVEGICDDDQTKLDHRKDDQEETVRNRLDVYHNETEPLINYYKNKGILKVINGEQPVDVVFKEIMEVLNS